MIHNLSAWLGKQAAQGVAGVVPRHTSRSRRLSAGNAAEVQAALHEAPPAAAQGHTPTRYGRLLRKPEEPAS